MKLFKISQNVNDKYDTFDSAIVCAESAEQAKTIHPELIWNPNKKNLWSNRDWFGTWAKDPSEVFVEEIGEANSNQKKGVILASFNAG